MYKITITDIAELTEDVVKWQYSVAKPNADILFQKKAITLSISSQMSFDADKQFTREVAKALAEWSLTKPGSDDTNKTVTVALNSTGEVRLELQNAFVVSYREHIEDLNWCFELVLREVIMGTDTTTIVEMPGNAKVTVDDAATSEADPDNTIRLSYGSRGDDVKKLQQRLNELGYRDAFGKPLVVDGIFGPKTEYAVNQYKDNAGLWNTGQYAGIVGPTTFDHIFSNKAVFAPAISSAAGAAMSPHGSGGSTADSKGTKSLSQLAGKTIEELKTREVFYAIATPNEVKKGQAHREVTLIDLVSELQYQVYCGFSPGYHSDHTPMTVNDTNIKKQTLLPESSGWNWSPYRPVILKVKDVNGILRYIAGSVHGFPHHITIGGNSGLTSDPGWTGGNNGGKYGGHFCLHYIDTIKQGSKSNYAPQHEKVKEAFKLGNAYANS